jgi:CBS domain-containing protein
MKTSVIRYRVADFLKQYAPFNESSEAELLALAASGRVLFHESDEYIFRKGQQRGTSIWVIQQGSVEIIDETAHGHHLRDLLGQGDLLGGEPDAAPYRYSAKATSDLILYTIDAKQFADLAAGNVQVARYLAAQSSINEGYGGETPAKDAVAKATWLDAPGPSTDFLRDHLLTICASGTVREAAAEMVTASSDWIAVVNEDTRLLGIVTDRDLRRHVAEGSSADTPITSIMNTPLATAAPRLGVGNYFLLMMKHRSRMLAITNDGSDPVLGGVVTDALLSLSSGHNPTYLVDQLLGANKVEDWIRLLEHGKQLLSSALTSPANVDLCSQMAAEFLNALLDSVIRQSEVELAAEGRIIPTVPYCWLLFGNAGRGEILVSSQPEIGVVFDDSVNNSDVSAYFSAVLKKTLGYLSRCRLIASSGTVLGNATPASHSLEAWKQVFQRRIADPISHSVHQTRSLFDFQPLAGDRRLVAELKQVIARDLQDVGPFIAILSNDTLSNLPPLTFFHGLVVELDGAQRDTLDIAATALSPIVDAARVFALAAGDLETTNTLARLERAAVSLPTHSAVLRGAAQAFRIAAYQQAIAGLRGGDGSIIRPSILTRYDQRLLKNAFDAIQQLLEVSSTVFDVAA